MGGKLFEEYRARRTSWRPARATVSSDSSWKEGGGEIRLGRRLLRTGAGNRASLASRAGRSARCAPPRVGPAGSEMVTFFPAGSGYF